MIPPSHEVQIQKGPQIPITGFWTKCTEMEVGFSSLQFSEVAGSPKLWNCPGSMHVTFQTKLRHFEIWTRIYVKRLLGPFSAGLRATECPKACFKVVRGDQEGTDDGS